MKFSSFVFLLLFAWSGVPVFSQATHTPLRKGDWAYDRDQFKAAEKHYRTAADRDMGNPQAVYNLGNTLYQQGNFEDAEQRFRQAANSVKTKEHRADALHNLGDAFLKQRKYKEAVKAYEESLRLRPGDLGSKQNLQMAKKQIKEEEKKEKEQQQQQQQKQDQNKNQEQSPQNQEDKQQDQSNEPQQNKEGQDQKPQGEQPKKQEEQRLKKEDAKRLLETAVEPDDRKNAQKYRAAQQQKKPKTSKKDW